MKVKIKEISRDGLKLKEQVTAEELNFFVEDLKVLSPLQVTAEIHKTRGTIDAQIDIDGKYEFLCSRCLDPVVQQRHDEFDIRIELGPSDDDIDLGEEIRQEMVLGLSTIVVCKEDCKGLCPTCGVNLNKEQCQCKK